MILFIPGGPWISGKYWDNFIQTHFYNHTTVRTTLLNHEDEYSTQLKPILEDLVDSLIIHFERQNSGVTIVAHSYGCLVSLLACDKISFNGIRKIIFLCMPFTNNRNEFVQKYVSASNIKTITNNFQFTEYFKYILPLYFSTNFKYKVFENITDDAFMEGNENLLIDDENLKRCLEILKTNEDKIEFIFGKNDKIITDMWKTNLSSLSNKTIIDSGHFPMLETPELLANVLKLKIKT